MKARGRQRTDATHVLAATHALNRLELVCCALQHTLEQLARIAPEWLRGLVSAEWYLRYARRLDDYRLPVGAKARKQFAEQVGQDGQTLFTWLERLDAPPAVKDLQAVAVLRTIWA